MTGSAAGLLPVAVALGRLSPSEFIASTRYVALAPDFTCESTQLVVLAGSGTAETC
jgi:hypothetical protein